MRRGFVATVIFGVIGLVILIGLGAWQLQRLEWKRGVLADINAAMAVDPVPLGDLQPSDETAFTSVVMEGRIGAVELYVLVSSRDYGAGYRVIAPFETTEGRSVLLDRGYVTLDGRANFRPVREDVQVIGTLHIPDDRNSATPENDIEGNIWFARDVDQMAPILGTEPVLVVARSDTGQGVLPMPVDPAAIPNNHLSYAIQWFLFAAVWVGMTSALLWRMRARPQA